MARGSFPRCSFPVIRIHAVVREAPSPSSGFTQLSEIHFSVIRIHLVVRIPFSVIRIQPVVRDPHLCHQDSPLVGGPAPRHQDSPSGQRCPSPSSGFTQWSEIHFSVIRIHLVVRIPFSVIRIQPVVRDPHLCHQDSPLVGGPAPVIRIHLVVRDALLSHQDSPSCKRSHLCHHESPSGQTSPSLSSGFTRWPEIPISVFRILLVVRDPHIRHQNYSVVRDPLLCHQDSLSSQRSPSLSSGFTWWSQIPGPIIRIHPVSEIPIYVIRIHLVVIDPHLCHQDSPSGQRSPFPSSGSPNGQRSSSPSLEFSGWPNIPISFIQIHPVGRGPCSCYQDSPTGKMSRFPSSVFTQVPVSVIRIHPVVRNSLLRHQDSPRGQRSMHFAIIRIQPVVRDPCTSPSSGSPSGQRSMHFSVIRIQPVVREASPRY
jgi:hypothetical protein